MKLYDPTIYPDKYQYMSETNGSSEYMLVTVSGDYKAGFEFRGLQYVDYNHEGLSYMTGSSPVALFFGETPVNE